MKFSTAADYTFKKRLQAVNMSHKFRLSGKDGHADIYPELLFQRLTATLFSFSRCPYPAAFAFFVIKMHEQKQNSTLLTTLKNICTVEKTLFSLDAIKYVLDGGHVLHTVVPW